ncbi:MAG TPA: DUF222 domain-containing protein [Actinomycetota bacterium]
MERSTIADARAELSRAVDRVQRLAAEAPELAVDAVRAADRLTATAAAVVARGGFETGAGLPAEIMLQLDARQTSYESRAITRIAAIASSMPRTMAAAQSGVLSWSQTRSIAHAVKPCRTQDRIEIDRLIGEQIPTAINADPDQLVGLVEDEATRRRRDLTQQRETNAVERSFIAFQPHLDGRASFYGEGDTSSIAGLINALDREAGPPDPTTADDPRTRAQMRYDALIALTSRAGGHRQSRSRPVIAAIIDIADLTNNDAAARLLWALTGRAPLLSPIGTQTMLCDSDIQTIVFRNGQPIAIGDPTSPIPRRIRRAVQARDQGCRFPGCHRPLNWTDLHHIIHRINGGRSAPENLLSLCRRCHRRIHNRSWKITINPGGSITFTHRRRRYESPPPLGPPRGS